MKVRNFNEDIDYQNRGGVFLARGNQVTFFLLSLDAILEILRRFTQLALDQTRERSEAQEIAPSPTSLDRPTRRRRDPQFAIRENWDVLRP